MNATERAIDLVNRWTDEAIGKPLPLALARLRILIAEAIQDHKRSAPNSRARSSPKSKETDRCECGAPKLVTSLCCRACAMKRAQAARRKKQHAD